MTVLDINKDGVNDLVVSAPQIGSAKLKYSVKYTSSSYSLTLIMQIYEEPGTHIIKT